jgi:hypothetical protein
MTRQEFENLKAGDVVVITQHGKNRGRQGTVSEISNGTVYLTPLNCEFEFSNKNSWRLHRRKEGLYGFGYESINYPTKELEFGSVVRNSCREDGCSVIAKVYSKEISVTFKMPLTDEQPDFWDELTTFVDKYFKK